MLHKLQTASPAVLSVNESKKTTEVSFSSSAGSRYGWPGDAIAVRHHPVPWRGRGEAEVASDPGQWSASTQRRPASLSSSQGEPVSAGSIF